MLKKIFYLIFGLAAALIILYFLQPLKKGKGLNPAVKYELIKDWLKLPDSLRLGNPAGIGIDTSQNIVIFHRAGREWSWVGSMPAEKIPDNTILIVDKGSGKLIESWGSGLFIMPHGLAVDNDNNIWVTDIGLHQVFKFTHGGKLLMALGEAGVAGNDSTHFNKPTGIAIANDGSVYVSDGYGNSRIVKFSGAGRYQLEWGKKSNKEGGFNIPHSIAIDNAGNVYVADRENNRIQVFDSNGKFMKQFSGDSFGAVCAVSFNRQKSELFAADDLAFLKLKHRGSDILIFDTAGQVQARFGRSGFYDGPVAWYHDLAVDSDENIYVGDILNNTIQKFKKISSK